MKLDEAREKNKDDFSLETFQLRTSEFILRFERSFHGDNMCA